MAGGKRGNNEGSITRRTDGLWEARITLPDGKRKSLYARTRQEVARKLAEALRDHDKGLPVVTDRQTVEQYFLSWLGVMQAKIRHSTWRKYEVYVRLHILPTLGKIVLAKLNAQQLKSCMCASWQKAWAGPAFAICTQLSTRGWMQRSGSSWCSAT
jgi:integrase